MKRKRIILVALAAVLMAVMAAIAVWRMLSPATGLSVPIDLVEIPPGKFLMGSPEDEEGRRGDETQHLVRITYAFRMGKYEVTQKQWHEVMGTTIQQQRDKAQENTLPTPLKKRIKRVAKQRLTLDKLVSIDFNDVWETTKWVVMGDEPWPLSGEGDDYPIYCVSWNEAMGFCARLTELERNAGRLPAGHEYRLPTEAEWEYACRAGSTTRFANGNTEADLDKIAWSGDNSGDTAHPVGTKLPNAWGLHDMHGNVEEWCLDRYGHYPCGSVMDPAGSSHGSDRVSRGGNWRFAFRCRAASRDSLDPELAFQYHGFRVVLVPSPPPSAPSTTEQDGKTTKTGPSPPDKPEAADFQSGKPWIISDLAMELMPVAPGGFRVGSDCGGGLWGQKPVHKVQISRGYWMGKTELTQGQWRMIMGNNPSCFKGDDLPVETVWWDDAVAFCVELSKRERVAGRLPEGYVYRLPTEAEWEYAARGGDKSGGFTYSGSNTIDEVAWFYDNSGRKPHPVGQKKANELGIHDMTGNVQEWCHDYWRDSPPDNVIDPTGLRNGSNHDHVFRGGAWSGNASNSQVTNRTRYAMPCPNYYVGFRIVLAPVLPKE